MTKCLFKALKAVDLDQHVGSFRSLGYDSAGALANFRAEHFEKLNCNEQELLRLIALLDVLKDATREGKICPHYFNSNKLIKKQQAPIKSIPIQASWGDETVQQRNFQSTIKKQSNVNPKQKRSISSVGVSGRSLSTSMAPTKPIKKYSDEVILQRPSTVLSRQNHSLLTKSNNQRYSGSKSFLNRPAIQHVKVKSYNYGIPSNRRARNSPYRATHQFTSNSHHGSIFASSSHHASDTISYAKPAEIYVYARKRPLLSTESNFQDAITVPDNKRIIIAENKANLDCTPLLKKTEFEFDQVFGSDASNKHIFEATVLPLISTTHRHNLTYICFGQTGSGKSHTIFGSRNTDGLLIHCTQLLLQETNLDNQLVCSFYEIYNNQVYDLVNAGKRLFVREDGDHHVNVIGVTEVALKNLDDLRCVIDDSLTRRHHGKSAFNSNSSRSHAVFQIILKNNYDSSENFRIIFIDLAGSERATDAQNNLRQTRREGAQINWSLLALKECIRSMDMTHSHAPFRQSKLTHILRDSLTGSKTRTCLMANVSPPDDCCQCSLNTLQYASRILDISSRHRHRSMPNASMHMSYSDDTSKQHEVIHEKPQRTFKPATASTPVHRLVSSVDQNIYKSTIHTDIESRTTKSIGIDWQVVDDDITLSGSDDNIPVKLLTSSTREFIINSNTNNHTQNNKHNFNRLQHKKFNDIDESPSSYFPQPQSNIKTSSSIKTHDIMQSYDSARLMYDDGNERQWKTVPAPTMSRLSNSAAQSSNTMRIVPVAPIELSDDNHPYNNSIGTESLGTKITTAVTHSPRYQKSTRNNGLVESLDLNKKYDSNAIITNIERTLHSDRSTTQKDQIEFLSNRDELLSIVSSRLTTGNRRTTPVTTPQTKRRNSQKESLNSPYSNKSKSSFSLTTKTRQKPRPIKSASSTSSLVKANQEKKSSIENQKSKVTSSTNCPKFHPTTRSSTNRHHQQQQQQQQRTVPLRIHHSSDSEEHEKIRDSIHRRKAYSSKNTSHSTRTEPCQTANNIQIMKKEQEQTDKYIFHEQNNFNQITSSSPLLSVPNSSPFPIPYLSPTYVPSSSSQAPLDQAKFVFHRSLEQPISPVTSTNINTPWQTSASYGSPSKEFGVRVSDQLNALRSLLETRLTHHDEIKSEKKDLNPVDSSPGIFAREFLQSLRQSSFKNNSREFTTNFLDDDQEVERNFHTDNSEKNGKLQKYDGDAVSSTTTTTTTSSNQHGYSSIHSQHFEQIVHRSLSALSDELNQAKVNLSVVSSSTSTIRSNLAAKIDTQGRNLSSQGDDIHSHQLANRNHQAVNDAKGARENASNPTSDSERTSQVNSTLEKNPFAGTSSGGSSSNESRSRSPIVIPPFSTYDITTNTNNYHDNLLDTRKGTSFMAGSSFDALLNSLKKMREKELGFIVPTGDDKLIPVAD